MRGPASHDSCVQVQGQQLYRINDSDPAHGHRIHHANAVDEGQKRDRSNPPSMHVQGTGKTRFEKENTALASWPYTFHFSLALSAFVFVVAYDTASGLRHTNLGPKVDPGQAHTHAQTESEPATRKRKMREEGRIEDRYRGGLVVPLNVEFCSSLFGRVKMRVPSSLDPPHAPLPNVK